MRSPTVQKCRRKQIPQSAGTPLCHLAADQEDGGLLATGVKTGSDHPSLFSFFPDSSLGWQIAANRTCQSDGHSAKIPWGDQHHRLPQNLGVSVVLAFQEGDFLSRHLGQKAKVLDDYRRDMG